MYTWNIIYNFFRTPWCISSHGILKPSTVNHFDSPQSAKVTCKHRHVILMMMQNDTNPVINVITSSSNDSNPSFTNSVMKTQALHPLVVNLHQSSTPKKTRGFEAFSPTSVEAKLDPLLDLTSATCIYRQGLFFRLKAYQRNLIVNRIWKYMMGFSYISVCI